MATSAGAQQNERRLHGRLEVHRPAKVYHPRSRRFQPCTAINVSQAGALLHLPLRIPLAPGERLMLGVQGGPRGAVLRSTEMMEVEVVRALTATDARQALGVRFVHAAEVGLNLAKLAA